MPTALRKSKKGQGLVEYALILVLAAIVVIVIVSLTGKQIAVKMCDVVIGIGGKAPDGIEACRAPRVTIQGLAGGQTVGGAIYVEAVVKNNRGLVTSTDHSVEVDFYIDNTLIRTEGIYRFCLGGGSDSSCAAPVGTPYSTTGLSNGTHTFRVVARDTVNNLSGETSFKFVVAN
jgi:Flp pilus assembly pilin Flp